jgi:hypothetical protein
MSARGFGSVIWAGAVAGAALGCYLVSLRVASERSALEDVETEIALAQRDIRLLQTEIGTRGRLAQLERWNVNFIRLSAPTADQFVDGGFQLATLVTPQKKPVIDLPVVMASAPTPEKKALTDDGGTAPVAQPSRAPSDMMHVAGYSTPPKPARAISLPASEGGNAKPPAVKKTASANAPKSAMGDPLAALPIDQVKAKATAPAKPKPAATSSKPKDSVKQQ